MGFFGKTVTENQLAILFMNGPFKMPFSEARRVAAILKNPLADKMTKFFMLIGMGIKSKSASFLAQELDKPSMGVCSTQEVVDLVKKVGDYERLNNENSRFRAFLHVLSVSGVENWSEHAKRMLKSDDGFMSELIGNRISGG